MMFQPFDNQNFEPSISNIKLPRAQNYTVQEAAARGLRWPLYSNDLAETLLAQNLPPIVGILIDPDLQAPYAMVFSVGPAASVSAGRSSRKRHTWARVVTSSECPGRTTNLIA